MRRQAEGSFQVTSWEESTYQDLGDGAKLTRASIKQDYSGDLQAKASWDALMCYSRDGTATYVGFSFMEGRIGDREGSFVLRADGAYDGSQARSTWSVVPGSGTGGLAGLSGQGSAVAPHGPNGTYTFEYELG
jgi:Protein of unknown function (DUF3224)